MATYVTLIRYTQQGIERIKESPNRLDAAKKVFEKLGGKLKQFYLVNGRYDIVVLMEAPDDETATRIALATAALGNVRTETMRAYTEEEFRKIVAGLP